MLTFWQVGTAAEAFESAEIARCGWYVLVQYGGNQPEYDLSPLIEPDVRISRIQLLDWLQAHEGNTTSNGHLLT